MLSFVFIIEMRLYWHHLKYWF